MMSTEHYRDKKIISLSQRNSSKDWWRRLLHKNLSLCLLVNRGHTHLACQVGSYNTKQPGLNRSSHLKVRKYPVNSCPHLYQGSLVQHFNSQHAPLGTAWFIWVVQHCTTHPVRSFVRDS